MFGVCESLVFHYVRRNSAVDAAPCAIEPPFDSVDFDFPLSAA